METPYGQVSAASFLVTACALATVLASGAFASEGFIMQAKVTRIHFDRSIDFWITSVDPLPRQQAPPAPSPAELPRVIATLELKDSGSTPGARDPALRGATIFLRGSCEELGQATRIPVIQVRFAAGKPWLQATLDRRNRTGAAGFQRLATAVCPQEPSAGPDPTDAPAPAPPPDGP